MQKESFFAFWMVLEFRNSTLLHFKSLSIWSYKVSCKVLTLLVYPEPDCNFFQFLINFYLEVRQSGSLIFLQSPKKCLYFRTIFSFHNRMLQDWLTVELLDHFIQKKLKGCGAVESSQLIRLCFSLPWFSRILRSRWKISFDLEPQKPSHLTDLYNPIS